MIISCPNCNKQFKINPSLIPSEGRDLKCGSCDNVWFYKIEDKKSKLLSLNEDVVDNEVEAIIDDKTKDQVTDIKENLSQDKIDDIENKNDDKIIQKQIPIKNKIKKSTSSKFFSYLIVSIISFIALVILVDTFKTPLINVFPDLEIILFNLFEILKDIKLFIIDLY
jgi:predicted Zn finger-like uncharacterized protein